MFAPRPICLQANFHLVITEQNTFFNCISIINIKDALMIMITVGTQYVGNFPPEPKLYIKPYHIMRVRVVDGKKETNYHNMQG